MGILASGIGIVAALAIAYFSGIWNERQERVKEVAQINQRIEDEREVWQDMMINLGSELTADANTIDANYRGRLADAGNKLAAALERERLRKRPATMPTATKPAGTPPAECRIYETSPGLLPDRDRELLIRLGYAANGSVYQRNAAAARYESARAEIAKKAIEADARARERGK